MTRLTPPNITRRTPAVVHTVAIADVARYVRLGKHGARSRGGPSRNSVYFDRVVPMLPEKTH